MPGPHERALDTAARTACLGWLFAALLSGCLFGQEQPLEDPRLQVVSLPEPQGFQAHLARAVELAGQGRPEGAAGVLEDLARLEATDLVPAGGGLYLPAHEALHETLAALGPAPRQAWHLLAGSEAERLLRLALAGRDQAGLLRLVRRYPGTEARDRALLALADLALERGQAGAALIHLARLDKNRSNLEPASVLPRSALAWAALGEWAMVRRTLSELERLGVSATLAGRTIAAPELAEFPAWTPPAPAPVAPIPGADEEAARLWLFSAERTLAGPPVRSTTRVSFSARGLRLLPSIQGPIAELDSQAPLLALEEDRLLIRHGPGLDLLELPTGRLLGRFRPSPIGAPELDPRFHLPAGPGYGLAERGSCRTGDLVILFTDMKGPSSPQRPIRGSVDEPPVFRAFGAWDLGREAWRWTTRIDALPQPLNRALLHAGPAVAEETVAVLLLHEGAFTAAGFSLGEGRLLWTRQLHGGGTAFLRPPVPPLLAQGETLFIATGAGALAALCARTGEPLWLHAYPRVEPGRETPSVLPPRARASGTFGVEPRGFEASPMILRGETLVLAPPDGDYLVGLHPGSGRLRWLSSPYDPGEEERKGPAVDVLVGADGETLYLAGRRLMALEISTGRRLWEIALESLSGRGTVAEQAILLPTPRGVLLVEKAPPHRQRLLDLPGLPAGPLRLALHGPFLIAAGLDRVGAWVAPAPWATAAEGLERARRLARCGNLAAALAALEEPLSEDGQRLRAAWSVDLARKAQAEGRLDQTRALLGAAAERTRSRMVRLRLLEELFLLLDRSGETEEAGQAFGTFLHAALEAAREKDP